METDSLRWFQLVADGVTVTEVSEIYGVSQPGVSRALARLEREVGAPLLRRSGRVLRLTHAGSAFKGHVDDLIHHLDDGVAAVSQLVDPDSGVLTLGFQLSLGTWLVPEIIAGFHRDHPRIVVLPRQAGDDVEAHASALTTGALDLLLSASPISAPGVRWARLFTEELFLAVGIGHRLAGAGTVSLAELAGEDFVATRMPSAMRSVTEKLCATSGFEPSVSFEVDDLPTLRGFVAAGLGVALAPAMGEDEGARSGVVLLRVADEGAGRPVGLAWPTERRLLPSAELMRRTILAEAGRSTAPAG